jgi:DNA-binding beta-propeller fold protein YncE
MKHTPRVLVAILAVAAGAVLGGPTPGAAQVSPRPADSLYVGDAADNSVERFDALTGQFVSTFIKGGLHGPRGILHAANLLVSNQNVNQPIAGEIDQFSSLTGKSLGPLVPQNNNPNAPLAPRGIIIGPDDRTLYVADIGHDFPECVGSPTTPCGAVKRYDLTTGPPAQFIGDLDFSGFITNAKLSTGEFRPRGLVFGPDGLLYVSLFSESNASVGFILSANVVTGEVKVVASYLANGTCSQQLHRPEGLVFGPDRRLYVTSFRADTTDIDRILIFNIPSGACVDEIELDQVGMPRAFAQALLFGPGGSLFVPITGSGPDTGAVRRYDVTRKTFTNFVAPGGPLGSGWYLTFGKTNPSTLAYQD